MNKHIVLLRGINVGGHNRLPMADLRSLLAKNGYKNVTTYIQSGNILLESNDSVEKITQHIALLIKQQFKYTIPVITITADEIITCFTDNPYLKIEDDIKNLHVTFLKTIPAEQLLRNLEINSAANDSFTIVGKSIYLHTPNGYQKTKFNNTQFEKKLNTTATTRNWKTTTKLYEMVTAAQNNDSLLK